MKLDSRAYEVWVDVRGKEKIDNLAPATLHLRWYDLSGGWKLGEATVEGSVLRKDGTPGLRSATVHYADPWQPADWKTFTPDWVRHIEAELHPARLNTPSEIKPEEV